MKTTGTFSCSSIDVIQDQPASAVVNSRTIQYRLYPMIVSRCTIFCSSFRRILLASFRVNHFLYKLSYFLSVSLLGYFALKVTKPKTSMSTSISNLDLFFTSVSATMVSSMSTVEMEVFSNTQLIIITILMFLGGEVFFSMLALQLELVMFYISPNKLHPPRLSQNSVVSVDPKNNVEVAEVVVPFDDERHVKHYYYRCIKYLGYVVGGYLLVTHVGISCLISMYVSLVPSAKRVLENKGLNLHTFSIFSAVSTFANCGFIPTNENMIVFKGNSGLLLILSPLALLGNTLYPPCLRILISVLEKVTKKEEFGSILRNHSKLGYSHMLSSVHSVFLFMTVFGFIAVQMILLCSMEWSNSEVMGGSLNPYRKFVAVFFQAINSRHAGESVFDLSAISPAVLVLFVLMMYLPPYTSYLPSDELESLESRTRNCIEKESSKKSSKKKFLQLPSFSNLSCLVVFIIAVCITERDKLRDDPLNFNLLSITTEVISAYGNVGLSTGYSCKRRLNSQVGLCEDKWYGLVGRWSKNGKLILILVMSFGRLKDFRMNSGMNWHLS